MTGTGLFDLEARSLSLCETRSGLIARNLANANTPNYKSVDLNFTEALQQANHSQSLTLSNQHHLQSQQSADGETMYYRIPMQNSQDGNTVDDEIERKNFIENALRYQASMGFAQNKASNLLKAIKGE